MRNPVKQIIKLKDIADGSYQGEQYWVAFYKDGNVALDVYLNPEEKENENLILIKITDQTNITGNVVTVEEWEAFKAQPWVTVEKEVVIHRGPYEDN
jgi:hypothetical protein